MSSRLAKIRFIADQGLLSLTVPSKVRSTIKAIEYQFHPYLYDADPPKEAVKKLGLMCEKIVANLPESTEEIIKLYEP
jgi:hypothetical protein